MNSETVVIGAEKIVSALPKIRKINLERLEGPILIKCKRLLSTAVMPKKAYPDSNCYDLYAPNQLVLQPFATLIVDLGLAFQFPPDFYATLESRGSLAFHYGIEVFRGIIDTGFTGGVNVQLRNFTSKTIYISKGNRIAQMAIHREPATVIKEARCDEKFQGTYRNELMLGSTGF